MGPKEEEFPQWSYLKQIQLKLYLEKNFLGWPTVTMLMGNFPHDAHR